MGLKRYKIINVSLCYKESIHFYLHFICILILLYNILGDIFLYSYILNINVYCYQNFFMFYQIIIRQKMARENFLIMPKQKFYSNLLLEEYKLDKN